MTNYDYIRGLPLEEMAKEIVNLPLCVVCDRISGKWSCSGNDCSVAAAEWLKFERETEVAQNGG